MLTSLYCLGLNFASKFALNIYASMVENGYKMLSCGNTKGGTCSWGLNFGFVGCGSAGMSFLPYLLNVKRLRLSNLSTRFSHLPHVQ
jgi:hypothetical protein